MRIKKGRVGISVRERYGFLRMLKNIVVGSNKGIPAKIWLGMGKSGENVLMGGSGWSRG